MTLNIDEANGITKGLRLIRCKEPHTNYPKYKHLWGYETTAHDSVKLVKMLSEEAEEIIKADNGLIVRTQKSVYYFKEKKDDETPMGAAPIKMGGLRKQME